jgi:hypothetical protein
LSDPLSLQAKHFTDDLCVFVTLGDLTVTKVVVNLENFVLPSPSWGFDSGKPNFILAIVWRGLGSRETRVFVGISTEM